MVPPQLWSPHADPRRARREPAARLAHLGSTSGIDRFADTTLWTTRPTGEPVFRGTTWLRNLVVDRLGAGTATLVMAQPVESNVAASHGDPRDALVYHDRTWHRLGEPSRIS